MKMKQKQQMEVKQKQQMEVKQYYFKNGKEKVSKKIADALEELTENGKLTPHAVVEAARSPRHPLHDKFEWDDTKAAEAHRLWQARVLISEVEVIIEVEGEQMRRNKYVNVEFENNGKGRGYITIEKALSTEEYRQQVLETALAELEYFRTKYEQYKELSLIFQSITKTRQRLKGGSR